MLDAWWKTLSARLDAGPAALHRLPETVAHVAEALWMQALDEGRRRAQQELGKAERTAVDHQQNLEVRSHVLTLREGELERCLLAVLDNAGAQDPKAFGTSAEVPRKSLTQNEVQALMTAEVTSRRTAVIDYERGGRYQDAARLRTELILLSRYVALDHGGEFKNDELGS